MRVAADGAGARLEPTCATRAVAHKDRMPPMRSRDGVAAEKKGHAIVCAAASARLPGARRAAVCGPAAGCETKGGASRRRRRRRVCRRGEREGGSDGRAQSAPLVAATRASLLPVGSPAMTPGPEQRPRGNGVVSSLPGVRASSADGCGGAVAATGGRAHLTRGSRRDGREQERRASTCVSKKSRRGRSCTREGRAGGRVGASARLPRG